MERKKKRERKRSTFLRIEANKLCVFGYALKTNGIFNQFIFSFHFSSFLLCDFIACKIRYAHEKSNIYQKNLLSHRILYLVDVRHREQ